MPIALIAHDRMKDAIVALTHEFVTLLRSHTLMATGTTGSRLIRKVGLHPLEQPEHLNTAG